MKTNKILLTGASGFLGGEIYRLLHPIYNIVGTCYRPHPRFRSVDLRNPKEIHRLLNEVQPDVIIHCAANRKPDECERAPDECRRINVQPLESFNKFFPIPGKIIFISTDYVFDGRNPLYTERDPCCAINVYGQSKVDAEAIVRQRENALILRVPLLVGKGRGNGLIETLLKKVLSAEHCGIDHCYIRHPTWVRDAARAVRFLLERGAAGIFHYSTPEALTKYEMAVAIAEVLGIEHDHIEPLKKPPPTDAPRPVDSGLDWSKIRQMGFTHSTPFTEVVRICLSEDFPSGTMAKKS